MSATRPITYLYNHTKCIRHTVQVVELYFVIFPRTEEIITFSRRYRTACVVCFSSCNCDSTELFDRVIMKQKQLHVNQ
jgi:hypothetical protein